MSTTETTPSANPLYDLMDDDSFIQQEGKSSESSSNPLYDMSTDNNASSDFTFETTVTTTTTADEGDSSLSANPLYDFMDSEGGDAGFEITKTETTTNTAAADDFLSMDFGGGGAPLMEKSTPAEDIVVEANDSFQDGDQIVPEVAAPEAEAGPRETTPEQVEAVESFDQNVELFIREEDDRDQVVVAEEVDGGVAVQLDVGEPQQQQQQEEEEIAQEEEVVAQEEVEEEQKEEVAQATRRSRSRSPSPHSISSEGEVINEVTFQSSSSISLNPASPLSNVTTSSPSSAHSVSASTPSTASVTLIPSTPHSSATPKVGRSVALLRLSRGQPAKHTSVTASRHEEELRQDGVSQFKTKEDRTYNETRHDGQPAAQYTDAGFGGAGQGYGLENGNIATNQTQKEDFHFQEMSSVKNQFEKGPQQASYQRQQPIDIKQEAMATEGGVYESQPTSSQPQWEEEPEEGVYENAPQQRSDVVRESDRDIGAELPSVGAARNIRDKFLTGQVENRSSTVKREITPPAGAVDGGVFENQPQYNPDVVHHGEETQNEILPEQGTTRNMAARFKEMEKQGSVPVPSGKRAITPDRSGKVEFVSEPRGHIEKYEPQVQAGIFESQPSHREDVVRSDQLPEEVLPEIGAAKNIAQRFKQMSTDNASSTPRGKREITPDNSGRVEFVSEPTGYVEKYQGRADSGVFESQPSDRDDVVKADLYQEEVLPERGMARNIAARFKEMENTTKSPPSPTKYKEITPPRENGTSARTAGVFESQPQVSSDVVHSGEHVEEVLPERGMAKNIANRFRQLSSSDSAPKSPRAKKEFTPPPGGAGVYENNPKQFIPDYNRPAESGILESKPEVRNDVVRGDEGPQTEQELPERGYTRNLLSAWKQRESESAKISPTGSGKVKEFTPPREEPRVAQQRPAPRTPKSPLAGGSDGSVHPTDLPGQYQPQVQYGGWCHNGGQWAEPTVFESEPDRRDDVMREDDTDWNAGMPKSDTTKKMLAKFQHIQAEAATKGSPARPTPTARKDSEDRNSSESTPDQVGRSKSMRVAVQLEKCGACQKTVYAMEKIEIEKHAYHKSCFRCSHCHCILTPKTFAINRSVLFCTNHYKQLFATKGNYDEGFGHDQHKKAWKSEPSLADEKQPNNGTEETQQ
ncbi:uncharacterized protein [Littorina saxatilis]|uniref:uncharacterized protein isoform X8 n=1 Tax=Littorina saxatilis TaxID=31220 RepID=UPI0038B4F320